MLTWLSSGYVLSGLGLSLTLIGAVVTARSIILTEDDAIAIGVARYGGTREENLRLPAVQNLLSQSKAAQVGMWLIALGTALQIIGVVQQGLGAAQF